VLADFGVDEERGQQDEVAELGVDGASVDAFRAESSGPPPRSCGRRPSSGRGGGPFRRKVADGLIARWPTSCWTIARAPVVDHFAAAVEFMIGDAADGDAYVVAIHPDRQ
jgi:hypothetical protein